MRPTTISSALRQALQALSDAGWSVVLRKEAAELPAHIKQRYPWLPEEVHELAAILAQAVSPDEGTWLLTVADYAGESESAFAWNEWERLCLEDDTDDEVRAFWDAHFPLLMSVADGYAYVALEQGTLRLVAGEEPEFEEVSPAAGSLLELLEQLAASEDES